MLFRRFFAACFAASAFACAHAPPHRDAVLHVASGIKYLQQGQCELAEARCRLALEYGDRFPEAHNCLGLVALACRGDVAEAESEFKIALSQNSDFAQAHNNLGSCFVRRLPADEDTAEEEFRAAIEIDPAYLDARENLAASLIRRGMIGGGHAFFRDARAQLIRLLELDPMNHRAHAYLGLMALEEHDIAEAKLRFRRCVEIRPDDAVCNYDLGIAHLADYECEPAMQALAAALAAPNAIEIELDARREYPVAHALCVKKDRAMLAMLDALRKAPPDARSHDELARIYQSKGMLDEAVREWRLAIALDPKDCAAHYAVAAYEDEVLDSEETSNACKRYIGCIAARPSGDVAPVEVEQVDRCKTLIQRIAME